MAAPSPGRQRLRSFALLLSLAMMMIMMMQVVIIFVVRRHAGWGLSAYYASSVAFLLVLSIGLIPMAFFGRPVRRVVLVRDPGRSPRARGRLAVRGGGHGGRRGERVRLLMQSASPARRYQVAVMQELRLVERGLLRQQKGPEIELGRGGRGRCRDGVGSRMGGAAGVGRLGEKGGARR